MDFGTVVTAALSAGWTFSGLVVAGKTLVATFTQNDDGEQAQFSFHRKTLLADQDDEGTSRSLEKLSQVASIIFMFGIVGGPLLGTTLFIGPEQVMETAFNAFSGPGPDFA